MSFAGLQNSIGSGFSRLSFYIDWSLSLFQQCSGMALAPLLMLYWSSRLWMKTVRGEVDEDPVLFAARDCQSLVIVTLMGAAFLLASTNLSLWN